MSAIQPGDYDTLRAAMAPVLLTRVCLDLDERLRKLEDHDHADRVVICKWCERKIDDCCRDPCGDREVQ